MLDSLDYQAVGLISGLEVHQQLLTKEKLFCRCPAGLYTGDPRRRGAAPHATDSFGVRGIRRHGADGVQDEERDRLPAEPEERLHLRDGRHASVSGEPGGHRRGHRTVSHHEHGHHRRGPYRPEAVSGRVHSDGFPAYGDRRRERLAAVQGPASDDHARQRRGGFVPRGEGQGPPDHLADGPAGNAADGDGDGAGTPHARGSSGRDPALRDGGEEHGPRADRASARAART